MFFGAPNCSAIGGTGVSMIIGGIVSTLGGGLLTYGGIVAETDNSSLATARFKQPGLPLFAKIMGHLGLFAPGAVGLGAGTGLIAAGTQH